MSYVGKILVVVQVVLSLLFMAFAGAVFSMQQNWKAKYEGAQATAQQTQTSLQNVQEEFTQAKRDFETALAAEKQRAAQFQAQLDTEKAKNLTLVSENNRLEAQRESQTGLAEAKQAEAMFRQQEAEKQRIENDKLREALDTAAASNRDLEDELFTTKTSLMDLRKRYTDMLEQTAFLERVVAANGLDTDRDTVEKMKLPPPPVNGVVLDTKKSKANRVQFVELSIGSDDGLIVNHELDVVRYSEDRSDSKWLGRVRIVDIFPDTSVGEVILPAKNGIIEAGDNVTSKL